MKPAWPKLSDEADRFLIHVRMLTSVLSYARSSGLTDDVVHCELAALGLDDARHDAFDAYISLNRLAKLMQRLARIAGDEAFGLHVAGHIEPGSIGVLGKAVVTAPDVLTGLEIFTRYIRLYADVSYVSLAISETRVEWSWAYSPLIVARDCLCDRAAHLFVLRLRGLFKPDWKPLQVDLQRKRPADPAPYRALLSPHIVFDAPANRIVFRREDLEVRNRLADPQAHEVALALADRMLADRRIPDDFSIRVREDILNNLADGGATIDGTARRLGVSARSLQRKLDDLSTSYHTISEDIRKALAEELLTQTNLPMGEIGYRLGYANQANLTRATRRWFGVSPRALRDGAV